MSMEESKEMRMKKEQISDIKSISETRKATITKYESQSIQIIDRKRTREDISSDVQLNKRIRHSIKPFSNHLGLNLIENLTLEKDFLSVIFAR